MGWIQKVATQMSWVVILILSLLIIFIVALALVVGFLFIKITEWISRHTI